MAKKRGKTKAYSKKPIKRYKSAKKQPAKIEKQKPVKDTLKELEILAEGKKIEQNVEDIKEEEASIEQKETQIMQEEKKIEKETEKVEKIEKEIKKEVTQKPLKSITIKDLHKAIIGAFIGVVAHFAFIYGKEIATQITMVRATILIIFSYVLIIILLYETGYREVKEKSLFGILPKRATVIYLVSIFVILVIFFLFNQLNFADIKGLYRHVAVTSILASLGAGTASLIGRD